jgi:two-component system, NtrC family, sensor kinase
MRLRTRTILLVFIFVGLLVFGLSLVGRFYLYPKFVQLEDEQAIRNANIGLELLNIEVNTIADRPPDWGYWDDTYEFVKNNDAEFIQSNLGKESQFTLQANLIALYDRQGNKLWSRAMNLESQKSFPLDEYEDKKLPLTHPFLSHEDSPRTRAGLMNSSYGPIFLASTPILYSDRTGPSVGTIIFGRLFNIEKVRRIGMQAGLELKLSPHLSNTKNLPPVPIKNNSGRIQHTPLEIVRNSDSTQVKTTLFSIDGKPSIDMQVSMSSDISKRGLKTLDTVTMAICVAGLLLSLVLIFMLNHSVVSPISRIRRHVAHVGNQEDFSARIQLNRDDEIGDLANEFDQMLQRLSDTRKRLFEQSYQTGASEMAQGVIQGIGKGIQPLRENIELPLNLLDKAHTSTSASLIHEMADAKIGSHRFTEITQQLLDLNNEQALVLAEARSEMRRLRIHVENLQEVVTDYSRYVSRATDNASIKVSNLISAASKKLDAEERQYLNIDIDPAVNRSAHAVASQHLLQQVINVLIAHFLETAKKSGRAINVRVTCQTEVTAGNVQLRFRFNDDRLHMEADEFQSYLADAWSPDRTESGLNLAWAENAVTSMSGKLYAEPSQTQEGIAVNLILPRAKMDET